MREIAKHGPFTAAEARAFIKRHSKGRALFVRAGSSLPIDGEPDDRVFPGSCLVKVPARTAIRYVDDVLSETLEQRGARIRVSMSDKCLFIG